MANQWQGGSNFVYAPQWTSGRSNSGNGSSKNPAMKKNGRFNPNVTRANHSGCQVSAHSKIDKERDKETRIVVRHSNAKGMFTCDL